MIKKLKFAEKMLDALLVTYAEDFMTEDGVADARSFIYEAGGTIAAITDARTGLEQFRTELPEIIQKALERGFFLGFASTSEGYNGEYPDEDFAYDPEWKDLQATMVKGEGTNLLGFFDIWDIEEYKIWNPSKENEPKWGSHRYAFSSWSDANSQIDFFTKMNPENIYRVVKKGRING